MSSPVEIDSGLDPKALAQAFGERKRLRIQPFLVPRSAELLRSHLEGATDWRHVIKGEENVFEASADAMETMAAQARHTLEEAIYREAGHAFRFRYDTIRVPDSPAQRQDLATPLARFAQFMSSPPTLEFFRQVTGNDDICFADAQATRYRRGDFLTRHDDSVGGKDRSHAFVLGLTPQWRPEWGGLLLFNGADGGVADAHAPTFNALDLFAVGQPHSVSFVAPYAASARISITGWLRTKRPDQ